MKFLVPLLICSTTVSALSLHGIIETEKFKEGKVKFYLWNKHTKEQEVHIDNYGNITTAQTKFLIHGFMDDGNGEDFMFYGPMVQTFLKTGVNVICIDWSYYSKRLYHESVMWLKSVAELVEKFIVGLKEKKKIQFSNIHLIGHSLGAHMSGFIGKNIKKKNKGEKIGRITGLDPAGPLFHVRPNTDRLYKTDATKVDTIIGDIILCGMNETLGQVNFYVWCGAHPLLVPLNHLITPFYYVYGILNSYLIGKECICQRKVMKDCKNEPTNNLGEAVDFGKSGTYYLNIDVANVMKYAQKAAKTAPPSKILRSNLAALLNRITEMLKTKNE